MNIFKDDNDFRKKDSNGYSDENKVTLWTRIFKNKDNQLYSDIIIRGFVWVLMFLVSVVALFFVFRDRYSDNKEVVVLNNKHTSYTDYFGTYEDNFEIHNKDNNVTTSTNKNNIKNKNLKKNNNNLVKNNIQELPPENTNSSKNTSSLDNLFIEKSSETSNDIDSLIKETLNSDINKQNNLINQSKEINKINTKTNKVNNPVLVDNKVWLVTVFSGKEESKSRSKWKEIYSSNPSLFLNKRPYFIRTNVEGKGIYYRVSLGNISADKSVPYFTTAKEATEYCKYLKANNVNCFVISSDKNLLKSLIN